MFKSLPIILALSFVVLTLGAVSRCHALEWVQPPEWVPDEPHLKFVGLTYSEHNGTLYLLDTDSKPYGLVNLRTGACTIFGDSVRVRQCEESVVVGRGE